MTIPAYMFDTVVFNRILDGALDIGAFVGKAQFYATHIQLDEINETSNSQRRQALLEVFNRITERKVPTESFVLGVSRLDEARLPPNKALDLTRSVGDLRPVSPENGVGKQ